MPRGRKPRTKPKPKPKSKPKPKPQPKKAVPTKDMREAGHVGKKGGPRIMDYGGWKVERHGNKPLIPHIRYPQDTDLGANVVKGRYPVLRSFDIPAELNPDKIRPKQKPIKKKRPKHMQNKRQTA